MTVCESKWTRALLHLFLYDHSAQGSEPSCFWPARKLHMKLALRFEWFISHHAGMKVNERSKETVSPLLHIHHRHVSHHSSRMSCCYQRKPVSHIVCSERVQNGSGCPFSLATSAWRNKSQRAFLFSFCNPLSCFQLLCYCCKSAWFLVCAASSLGMDGGVWISLIWAKHTIE